MAGWSIGVHFSSVDKMRSAVALLIMMGLDLAVASGQGKRGTSHGGPSDTQLPNPACLPLGPAGDAATGSACLSTPCTLGGITLGARV